MIVGLLDVGYFFVFWVNVFEVEFCVQFWYICYQCNVGVIKGVSVQSGDQFFYYQLVKVFFLVSWIDGDVDNIEINCFVVDDVFYCDWCFLLEDMYVIIVMWQFGFGVFQGVW